MKIPQLLVSDGQGNIFDLPNYRMAGRSARDTVEIDPSELIELPQGSQLFFLPGRKAVGYHSKTGRKTVIDDHFAVAAYIPPSYTHFLMAAYEMTPEAPRLPLHSYTAVGWLNEKFYVAAVHVDQDIKQLPTSFDDDDVKEKVNDAIRSFPGNRLIAHHGRVCAIEYGCPNAKNFFLNRWEAPIAVASACNANCIGCISFQPKESVSSPQQRLNFVPTVEEIVELAVPHLETAERAIISFGQGCEGEPLLQGALIEKSIREIRKQTARGILHINTNGSKPDVIERLFEAGLDSIRVSTNSAQAELYHRYYKPNNYRFEDIVASLMTARTAGKFASINYFVFPGITDSEKESDALLNLINRTQVHLIQWRNFNIDPEWYLTDVCYDYTSKPIGVHALMNKIHDQFPQVQFGYLNKCSDDIERIVSHA
ncbi:radical SAM protein [bacterium]|nr:radical SAM protein [bacterium]